jgi:hypothetical protein
MILLFCREIFEVLIQTLGNMIQEIDDIDLVIGCAVAPTWTWTNGPENKHPHGEVGILQYCSRILIQLPSD